MPLLLTRVLTGAVLSMFLLLAGCGGGPEAKTGSNGTGLAPPLEDAVASGPLISLGPEGVSSVTLEGGTPQVLIDTDGNKALADLRLGMPVEVRGRLTGGGSSGSATLFNAQSIVIGPLLSADHATGRLVLPGVVADTDANTIFDGVAPLASLAPGTSLEIYGLPKPAGGPAGWLATRIVAAPQAAGTVSLYGTVSSTGVGTLTVSGLTVNNANVTAIPAPISLSPLPSGTVTVNSTVRVVGTYVAATNSLNATQVIAGLTPLRPDSTIIVLDGFVQSVSAPGQFRLGDVDVRTSVGVTVQPGSRVRVRGVKQAGVLEATEVALVAPGSAIDYTVTGEISRLPAPGSLVVRGETVQTGSASIVGGTATDLVPGRRVRLKLRVLAGALVANEIQLL